MDVSGQLKTCYATLRAGNVQAAESQYQSIIAAESAQADAHHLGAHIAEKSGRLDIALQRVNLAIKRQSGHHEYFNTKGNILKNLQDAPGAITAYKASLEAKPDYLAAAQNLGKFLIDSADPVAAINVYEAALRHHKNDNALKLGLVVALKDAMRNDDALAALGRLGGSNEHAYLRGQILFQLSRHDEAIQSYLEALNQKHLAPVALKNLLQILWMRGDWQRAENIIKEVLQVTDVATTIAAARAYILADDLAGAGLILENALQKFGRAPYILSERARLKLMHEDYESGYQDALEALTARPGDLKIMEDFADTALAAGHHNDAMIAAHSALKIVPNNQYWIAIKYTAGRAMGQNHGYYANYDAFVRPYVIEPPEGYGSLEQYNAALKQALNELHEFSQHPLDQSLRQGVQTTLDLRLVDHPVLIAHFKALEKPIRQYMREIGNADPSHPLLRRNTDEYRLTGSWSVRLGKGGFHVNHVHPEGWISSAYYVDVPDEVNDERNKPGWIHFGQPPYPVKGLDGKSLGYEHIVKPTAGTLVLFPSYLWHGTNPLCGEKSRMTLPIDVVPA